MAGASAPAPPPAPAPAPESPKPPHIPLIALLESYVPTLKKNIINSNKINKSKKINDIDRLITNFSSTHNTGNNENKSVLNKKTQAVKFLTQLKEELQKLEANKSGTITVSDSIKQIIQNSDKSATPPSSPPPPVSPPLLMLANQSKFEYLKSNFNKSPREPIYIKLENGDVYKILSVNNDKVTAVKLLRDPPDWGKTSETLTEEQVNSSTRVHCQPRIEGGARKSRRHRKHSKKQRKHRKTRRA